MRGVVTIPLIEYLVSNHSIVYNFLLRIGYIPGTISMPPQPSLANTDAKIATVDLATPLSKIGGLEKESDGKQGKVIVGKHPRQQSKGQE